jgi:hypothetical protein
MMVLHRCRGAFPRLQEPIQLDFEAGRAVIARDLDMDVSVDKKEKERKSRLY